MKKLCLILSLFLLLPLSRREEIRRIDGDGYLYYMDYTGDYYSSEVMDQMRKRTSIPAALLSLPIIWTVNLFHAGTMIIRTACPGKTGR